MQAMLTICKAGDNFIASSNLYGPSTQKHRDAHSIAPQHTAAQALDVRYSTQL
jgi:O-acetylhomoserine/O-acetylserine sulfhydrylase-like pyridoxal-dependent enzyme